MFAAVAGGRAAAGGADRPGRPVRASPARWRWPASPWCSGGRRPSRCSTRTCRAAGCPRCSTTPACCGWTWACSCCTRCSWRCGWPIPALLVQAGLPKAQHWHVYLPAVLGSFVIMGGAVPAGAARLPARRVPGLRGAGDAGAGRPAAGRRPAAASACWALLLFVFFCGFNVLEAIQPSMVSRMAPAARPRRAPWACTTRCNPWVSSQAGRSAAGWPRTLEQKACSPPAPR